MTNETIPRTTYTYNPAWSNTSKTSMMLSPFQEKIDAIHEQVIRGDLVSVRKMLDKKGWACARDHYGHSPLHKAVMANQEDIVRFVLDAYPELREERDNVSSKTIVFSLSCY